jgi:hypothetical protein
MGDATEGVSAMLHRQSMALLAVLGVSGSMGATPAAAHHSLALFDMQKSVRLEGTVKRFDWTNPHSWIFLEVMGPEAMTEAWTIELPSAGVLAREGWNKNYLRTGERVVLHVNPLKDGRRGGSLEAFVSPSRRQSTR